MLLNLSLTDYYNTAATALASAMDYASVGIVGGFVMGVSASIATSFINDKFKEFRNKRALKKSGLADTYNNTSTGTDRMTALNAVRDVLEKDDGPKHIFIEFADRAFIARQGDNSIIELDFSDPNRQERDSQIWTRVKEMIGQIKPNTSKRFANKEIYTFAKECTHGEHAKSTEIKSPLEGLDDTNQARIKEHAKMRCSWARQQYDDNDARRKITETIVEKLKALARGSVASNLSGEGLMALTYGSGCNSSMLIKPLTDFEKEILFENHSGVTNVSVDSTGRHLDGNEGLEIYAKVKQALIEKDNAEVERQHELRDHDPVGIYYMHG